MNSGKENSLDLIEACFDHIYKARKSQLVSRSTRYATKLQAKSLERTKDRTPNNVKVYSLRPQEDEEEEFTEDDLIQGLSSKFSSTVVVPAAEGQHDEQAQNNKISQSQQYPQQSTPNTTDSTFKSQYKKFLEIKQKVDEHPDNELEREYVALQSDIQSVIKSIQSTKNK